MLDFHNHLIPGVDDGAADIGESRSGIKAMIADGVTEIIATPHITASLARTGAVEEYQEHVAQAWSCLKSLGAAEFPQVGLYRGFEVMLDVPHPKLDDPLLRLAGTSFVLVEFPFMNIPPNSAYALRELIDAGLKPIVAHPERYTNMEASMGLIDDWRDAGAYLQINAGSLVGNYGSRADRISWFLLQEGQADYLCSDFHSRGTCALGSSRAALTAKGLTLQLMTLDSNASRIVKDEVPNAMQPFVATPTSKWKKILGLGRR